MKWKMIKLLLPLLLMVFVIPMIMPGPNGRPVMTWRDWFPDASSIERWRSIAMSYWNRAASGVEKNTGIDIAPEPTQIYKWQDANGNWHFTDRAAMANKDATREELSSAINTMAPPPVINREQATSTQSQSSIPLPLPTTVPVDKIPQLIDDAKNLQKLSDDRAKQIDDL